MRPIPNIQVANCERKLRWDDELEARAATSFLAGSAPGGRLWIYHCRTCAGWHCTKRNHGLRWLVTQGKPYAD